MIPIPMLCEKHRNDMSRIRQQMLISVLVDEFWRTPAIVEQMERILEEAGPFQNISRKVTHRILEILDGNQMCCFIPAERFRICYVEAQKRQRWGLPYASSETLIA